MPVGTGPPPRAGPPGISRKLPANDTLSLVVRPRSAPTPSIRGRSPRVHPAPRPFSPRVVFRDSTGTIGRLPAFEPLAFISGTSRELPRVSRACARLYTICISAFRPPSPAPNPPAYRTLRVRSPSAWRTRPAQLRSSRRHRPGAVTATPQELEPAPSRTSRPRPSWFAPRSGVARFVEVCKNVLRVNDSNFLFAFAGGAGARRAEYVSPWLREPGTSRSAPRGRVRPLGAREPSTSRVPRPPSPR